MNFTRLKNIFGLNLFALIGYLPILFLIYDFWEYQFKYIGMGIWIYGLIEGCLITISLLIWIIELLCKQNVNSNYILENKTYNIIWFIGFISSCLCFLFFLFILVLGLLQRLGYYTR